MADATAATRAARGTATPSLAVVGIACRFPDADDPAALLDVVLTGRRSFRRLPPGRMNLADYYQADQSILDATYSTRAAVLEGWKFDCTAFGIEPAAYAAADPAHWLALETTARALAAAGLPAGSGLDLDRTGVIIGNTLAGDTSRANALRVRWPYVRRVLTEALGTQEVPASQAGRVLRTAESSYLAPFPAMGPDSLAGSMPATIASSISAYFGFRGGSHAVDSTSSSSLQAVASACAALAAGDLDAVIAGGVDLSLDPLELIGLAKAGLLATGDVRIYDREPTGFLPGEGCGVVVLMRTADARAADLPVFAEIVGWGTAGGGVPGEIQSHAATQLLAMRRAYERAAVDPADIQFIEGNGAATSADDAAELSALSALRAGATRRAAIGSVKANIGHAKAAAGAAGLIKTVLALGTGVVPPTTGVHRPHELIAAGDAGLVLPQSPEEWPAGPRFAAISTIGAGGSNVHLVLRHEPVPRSRQERWLRSAPFLARTAPPVASDGIQPRLQPEPEPTPFLLHAPDKFALAAVLSRLAEIGPSLSDAEMQDLACTLGRDCAKQGRTRVALVATRQEQLAALAREAVTLLPLLADGLLTVRPGIFASDDADGRVTLLLSGEASGPAGEPSDAQPGPVALTSAIAHCLDTLRWLDALEVNATGAVGHGLGALAGLAWAGALGEAEVVEIADLRAQYLLLSGARDDMTGMPTVGRAAGDPFGAVGLRAAIGQRFRFGPPRRRLISTLTGTEIDTVDDAIDLICSGFTGADRMAEAVADGAIGATLLVESGPGRTLAKTAAAVCRVPAISLQAGFADAMHSARVAAALFAAGALGQPKPLFAGRPARPVDIWREQVFISSPCEVPPRQPAESSVTVSGKAAGQAGSRHVAEHDIASKRREFERRLPVRPVTAMGTAGLVQPADAGSAPRAELVAAEAGPPEAGPAEAGPAETGPAETGPPEAGPATRVSAEPDLAHAVADSMTAPAESATESEPAGLSAEPAADGMATAGGKATTSSKAPTGSRAAGSGKAARSGKAAGGADPAGAEAAIAILAGLGAKLTDANKSVTLGPPVVTGQAKAAKELADAAQSSLAAPAGEAGPAEAGEAESAGAGEAEPAEAGKAGPAETGGADGGPAEPVSAESAPAGPVSAELAPAEPALAEPVSAESAPAEPASAEPAPAESASAESAPAEPAPAEPDAIAAAAAEIAVPSGMAVAPVEGVGPWARCFTERLRPAGPPSQLEPSGSWHLFSAAREPALAGVSSLFTADAAARRTLAIVTDPADDRSRAAALKAARDAVSTGALVVLTTSREFTGFFASLHAEHPSIGITVLRLPAEGAHKDQILRYATAEAGRFRELVIDSAGAVSEPDIAEVALTGGADSPLGPDDVIVISRSTGGAGLALAQVLACCGTGVAVVGRAGENDDEELVAGLEELRSAGARVSYEIVDVADKASLIAAVRRIEERLGKVTALAHSARDNDPVPILELTDAQVRGQLTEELTLLSLLAGAIRPGQLALIVSVGSVTDRYGLAGAGVHALSSGALASRAEKIAHAGVGCQHLHIDLPAWSAPGLGNRPQLAAELAAADAPALDVAAASRLLLRALTTPGLPGRIAIHGRIGGLAATPAPVITRGQLGAAGLARGGRFLREVEVHYPGIELVCTARLSLASDPYLADYRIDGMPVLPPVLALEALAQVASVLAGQPLRRAADVRLDSPVLIPSGGEAVLRVCALRDGEQIIAALHCADSSYQVDHARASFSSAPAQSDMPEAGAGVVAASAALHQLVSRPSGLVDGAELYGPISFQSGRFRRIAFLPEITARSGRALARGADEHPWYPARSELAETEFLLGSPGLNDAALQVLQACVPHRRVRAAAAESVQFSGRSTEGPVEIRAVADPVRVGFGADALAGSPADGDGGSAAASMPASALVPGQAGAPKAETTGGTANSGGADTDGADTGQADSGEGAADSGAGAADSGRADSGAGAADSGRADSGAGAADSGRADSGRTDMRGVARLAGKALAAGRVVAAVAPEEMTAEELADMEIAERRPQLRTSRKSRRNARRRQASGNGTPTSGTSPVGATPGGASYSALHTWEVPPALGREHAASTDTGTSSAEGAGLSTTAGAGRSRSESAQGTEARPRQASASWAAAPVGPAAPVDRVPASQADEPLADGTPQLWNVEAVDSAGQLVAAWRGVQLHDSGPLPRNAAWPPTLLSVYLERSAVDLGLDDGLRVTVSCGQPDGVAPNGATTVPRQSAPGDSRPSGRGKHAGPERRAMNTASAPGSDALAGFVLTLRAPVPVACGWAAVEPGHRQHKPAPGMAASYAQLRSELAESTAVLAARFEAVGACLRMADMPVDAPSSGELTVTQTTGDGWTVFALGRARIACGVVELSGVPAPVAIAILTRRYAHARSRKSQPAPASTT